MRRPAAVALACLAATAACGDPLAPLPARAPRELTYVVDSGLLGVTTDVRLTGDTVVAVFSTFGPQGRVASELRRVPTAEEWRAFARAVGAAGVRRWPAHCSDDRIADAGEFSYTLAYATGTRFAGSYYAQSPTARGRCSAGDRDDAAAFERAVLALTGVVLAL